MQPVGPRVFVIFQETFKLHEYRTSLFDFVDIATPEAHTMSIVGPTSPIRRSCIQCRVSKKGCNREVPSCQSCCARGMATQCTYEEHMSLPLRHSTKALFGSMESKRKTYQAGCMRTEALDEPDHYLQYPFDHTAIWSSTCSMRPYFEMEVPVSLFTIIDLP